MKIRWYGQSTFALTGEHRVAIDPFGDMSEAAARGRITFDYPPIDGLEADLLLITHEHMDHNGAEAVGGDPVVIRSTAGTFESPVGEVVGVSSEHDGVAGTQRGPNTIYRFTLDGVRVCHLGDLGQPALRPEQIAAIGEIDVLFVPAGDGPTVGGEAAAQVVRDLRPRLAIPMHYRTPAIGFLDPPDAFLEALGAPVEHADSSEIEVEPLLGSHDEPRVVLLAPPLPA
ncbi:MAG TPA: MBL fold metallo-hydrolase [Gaiellaceae bacterium]|jgi:L-ascorbate metabolism protein UlaG (beta-lactamase superfamily)|nr:MBL fold metallo-hydrolase [Gaiellaceae bacterium]